VALAHPGPWVIAPSTLALGATQEVTLTEGGPWIGPDGCADGFTEGARRLRDYLEEHFPVITGVGGYNCRAIVGLPDQMSVHGTGRALDLFIATDGGAADNDAGDPLGSWLIENAEHIGIQRVIWDRWMWSAYPPPYRRDEPYDWEGTHPHHDHLHVEISVRAAELDTAFFSGPPAAPIPAGCDALAAEGGMIDDGDACFTRYGDPRYWRVVEGEGTGGSYFWTNAWTSAEPANWARWSVRPSVAGEYEVEVHVPAGGGAYEATRYAIVHDGVEDTRVVDQSSIGGWRSLGAFLFAAAGSQHVAVYDNYAVDVGADPRVAVDAIRLSRIGSVPPDDPPLAEPDAAAPRLEPDGAVPGADAGIRRELRPMGGCRAAPARASPPVALLLVVLLAARRRARNASATVEASRHPTRCNREPAMA
jgi:hypothetical protein